MSANIVRGFHHSGRWDRKPEALAKSIKRTRAGRSFGTRTEVGNRAREAELRRDPAWKVCRPDTPFGLTDCSVEWDPDVWEKIDAGWEQLTTRRIYTTKGVQLPPTILVWAALRHRELGEVIALGTMHRNLRNTARRRVARISEAQGFRTFVRDMRTQHPGWAVVIQYDENSNQRLRLNRRALWATMLRGTGLRNMWGQHAKHTRKVIGTHGRSLLDVCVSTCRGKTTTLAGDDSSDHRPFETTLQLGTRWK